MKIRTPLSEEILETLLVFFKSFNRAVPHDIDDLKDLLNHLISVNIANFLIAEVSSKIIAMGGSFIFGKVCSLGYLSVLKEHRGKGIGTKIFKMLMEQARSLGCKSFILYASELGRPIYTKIGFKEGYFEKVYDLPKNIPENYNDNEEVQQNNKFSDWMMDLDKVTHGFNRTDYLNIRIQHGSKLIFIEDEAFALVSGTKLGPLIAKNLDSARNLIYKGILLGADHIIIPLHSSFHYALFNLVNLTERGPSRNLMMTYGNKLKTKLSYLYAIGNYAKSS